MDTRWVAPKCEEVKGKDRNERSTLGEIRGVEGKRAENFIHYKMYVSLLAKAQAGLQRFLRKTTA